VDLTCTRHHAYRGQVVRCELGVGHTGRHATEAGKPPKLVSWWDNTSRRDAEVEAARWRREHGDETRRDDPAGTNG
jgi:hypothetical protein